MFQKKVVEKIQTHILCSISLFENCAIYEIIWKKCCTVGQTTNDNMDDMLLASWIPKATNTHSVCVILIAFLLQEWLHK
jgi:hypothetical protein